MLSAVMLGVTLRMMPTVVYWMALSACRKCRQRHAGDERNLVADLNGRHLIVAGQDGGAGKDFDLAHFLDGAQGGGEIVADDTCKCPRREGW